MATLLVLKLLMLMTVTVTNIRTVTTMTNTDIKWRHTYPYFHHYMLCGNEREEEKVSSRSHLTDDIKHTSIQQIRLLDEEVMTAW